MDGRRRSRWNTRRDDGYGWHALLCAAFGKADAPKPFRIVRRRNRPVQLLAYSPLTAAELLDHAAAFADPKAFLALGVTQMASKPMPAFMQGRRLGFSLLARPVVRADRHGDRAKSREIDAFVHARAQGDSREKAEIYLDWIGQKMEAGGADVEALRLDGLESGHIVRRAAPGAHGRPLRAIAGPLRRRRRQSARFG